MFHQQRPVIKGGLASYGGNDSDVGRLTAKHVQRILAGTEPKDLSVESYDKIESSSIYAPPRRLAPTIPPFAGVRADRLIE